MMCSLLCAQHCHYCMQMPDVDSGLAPAASAVVHFSTLALCCRAVEMNHDIFFLNLFFCYLLYEYSIPLKQPGWFFTQTLENTKLESLQVSNELRATEKRLHSDSHRRVDLGGAHRCYLVGGTKTVFCHSVIQLSAEVQDDLWTDNRQRRRSCCRGRLSVGPPGPSGLTVPFLCHALKGIRSSK